MKKQEMCGETCVDGKQTRLWTRLLYMMRGAYFLLYTLILILVVFFRNTMQYVWDMENKNLPVPQWVLLLLGVAITAGMVFLCFKYREWLGAWCRKYAGAAAAAGTVLLFFVQLYISSLIYFSPGWDSGLLVDFAQHMENGTLGEIMDDVSGYFSLAPNNILLTLIFQQLIHFSRMTGIFAENGGLMMLIMIQCVISSVTVYLVYRCVLKTTESRTAAFAGWFAAAFFVGLSAWMVFPYSDATGMLFPICNLSVYLLWEKKYLPVKWMVMSVITVFGYFIKPQTVIVFLAILIVEGLRWCREKNRCRVRLLCIAAALLAVGSTYTVCGKAMEGFKTEIGFDEEKSLGILHYMMLGLNEENAGMYSFTDVEYSMSFETKEERDNANLSKIKERITQYGAAGLLKHWQKKMTANYGDGTFGWGGQEGGFYIEIYPEKNLPLSWFLRSVYYSGGEFFAGYFTVRQMVWLVILLLMGGAAWRKGTRAKDNGIDVMILSVIGLTLFELIFEAHAKYLYTYAPFFVMLSVIGLHTYIRSFLEYLCRRQKDKEQSERHVQTA